MLAVALAAAALAAVPVVSILVTALGGSGAALTALAAPVLPAALAETVALLAGVAVVTGIVGTGTAWLVTAFRFPGSRLLAFLLPLPLAVPTYVTALVYVELLDAAGPVRTALRLHYGRELADGLFPEIRSLPGCIAVLSAVLYPYVFVASRVAFLARDPAIAEAARVLGAGPLRLFRSVALPLARPAVAVGVTLALLEALNDIGAAEHLGVRTLTVSAYTAWLNRSDLPGAAQIAAVVLAAVLLLLSAEAVLRRRRLVAGSAASSSRPEPIPLGRGAGLAAAVACVLPVALGLVVPVLFLAREIVRRDLLARLDPAFGAHLLTTAALALAATVAVLALAIPVAVSARALPARLAGPLLAAAGSGYAIPGTILVLGLLPPLLAADGALTDLGRWAGRDAPGLFLVSSGLAVALAYTIRFLRIGTATLAAQLAAMPIEIDRAARSLGAGPGRLARLIQLPLLRPAIGGAALLVFVDCVKELPATLLLRPVGAETLATLVYGAISRGTFEDGALAALVIVAAGLLPVVLLTRGMEGAAGASPSVRVPAGGRPGQPSRVSSGLRPAVAARRAVL